MPGLAIQGLAYFWLDWRRRRMGGTGPGGCLQGIGRATSCLRRCIARGLRTRGRAGIGEMGWSCAMRL